MKKVIPYGRQNIDQIDIDSVIEVLRSRFITTGPKADEFEAKLADYCGAKFAVVFNSGTSALHGAMYAAGIGSGDEVITTPMTFLASANAALYVGAKPVFVDIDLATYCIDITQIKEAVNSRTKAIVPVDYAGYPVDIDRIREIAKQYNLVIIEDAAHALGAYQKDSKVGTRADMTMFSFHPVKHITTGEGGVIVTDNEEYYLKLRAFRNHGIVREELFLQENHGPWYYEMQDLGYNYRITDFQCALGISQMSKLEGFISERNHLALYYDEVFKELDWVITPPRVPEDSRHAYHLYPLLLEPGIDRFKFFNYLWDHNIRVQVHYIPIHLQPYYREHFGYKLGDFPVAEDFYKREISLPLYPGLSKEEQDYIIKTVKAFK